MKNPPTYEDGTDSEFRNVGQQHTDAGELPKRKWTTKENICGISMYFRLELD
jgi:hypothetical protein